MDVTSRGRWLNLALILVLFVSAFLIIQHRYDPGSELRLYFQRYGPAVALACEGKLGVISFNQVPSEERAEAQQALSAFLNWEPTPRFDCANLPEETEVLPFSVESNHMRFYLRYQIGLYAVVGSIWSITGPAWEAVGWVATAFAAAAAVCLFLVARFFAGVVPSIILVSIVVSNPINIERMSLIRDYTKTFFVIAAFLAIMTITLQRWQTRRAHVLACLGLGVFLGLGISFRQDMMASFLLSTLFIMFFPAVLEDKSFVFSRYENRAPTLLPSVAIMIGFVSFASLFYVLIPVDHSNEGHFFSLGTSLSAFENAGMDTGEFLFNPWYRDFSSYALINAYVIADRGIEFSQAFSEDYNNLSRTMLIESASHFPFYIISRAFFIFRDILSSDSIFAGGDYEISFAADYLLMWSVFCLSFLALYNVRIFSFVFLFFMGISFVLSLQYIQRHYFHIHMLWYVVSFSTAFLMLRLLAEHVAGARIGRALSPLVTSERALGFPRTMPWWLLPTALLALSLLAAATYLGQSVRSLAWKQNVLEQPVVPARYSVSVNDSVTAVRLLEDQDWIDFGGRSLSPDVMRDRPLAQVGGGYLEIRLLASDECAADTVDVQIRYAAEHHAWDLTHVLSVPLSEGRQTSRFSPLFLSRESGFDEFWFVRGSGSCLEGLYWVTNFPAIRLPIGFTAHR